MEFFAALCLCVRHYQCKEEEKRRSWNSRSLQKVSRKGAKPQRYSFEQELLRGIHEAFVVKMPKKGSPKKRRTRIQTVAQ